MQVRPLDTLLAVKALSIAPGLKENDRRVAVVLIEHFNRKSGRCDPGLERIAVLIGISTRTVIRSIHRLVTAGLFRKKRHGGHLNRNSYEPIWPKIFEIGAAWTAQLHRRAADSAPQMSPTPRQACHIDNDAAVHQTCQNNLIRNETCLEQPSELTGRRLPLAGKAKLPIRSSRSSDAARAAAELRWSNDIHKRFASNPLVYGQVIQAIDLKISSEATEAEMGKRGAGFAYIARQLQLLSTADIVAGLGPK